MCTEKVAGKPCGAVCNPESINDADRGATLRAKRHQEASLQPSVSKTLNSLKGLRMQHAVGPGRKERKGKTGGGEKIKGERGRERGRDRGRERERKMNKLVIQRG